MIKKLLIALAILAIPSITFAQFTFSPQGGVGVNTASQGDMFYAASVNPIRLTKLTIGSNGACLTSNGSIPLWGGCGGAFSTTSVDYWKSVNNFFSTTSANYWLISSTSIPTGLPTNGNILLGNGTNWLSVSTSSLGITNGTISTSSPLSPGQSLYATGLNTIAGTATGTISAGTGFSVTAGQSVIGSGLTIGADGTHILPLTASTTQWNNFYNSSTTLGYQATLSTPTWPITLTGTTLAWGGMTTTTPLVAGNILTATNGTTGIGMVATSTLTPSTPLTGSFSHIGTTGSLGWSGLATTTALTAGTLLTASNGTTGVGTVATSTVTISSPLGGSITMVGTGGTLTCATCNTSNATLSSLTFSTPLTGGTITTSGTVGWSGLATTSSLTAGNFLVAANNTTGVANYASSSVTVGKATALATARAINGVNFDGTAAITIQAASSTLLADLNTFANLQTFGSASSTNFSATNLCIGTVCNTSWPAATLSGGSPNTLTFWTSGSAVSATGSPTVGYIYATSTTPSTFINASTTNLSVTGSLTLGGVTKNAWPSGGAGTWSTTTSQTAGQLINYPNNTTDIVVVGASSTTTAPFYIDPNQSTASLTVGGSATTTLYGSSATSTFGADVSMAAFTTSATSTPHAGINLTAGCFAISGTCVTGGGSSLSGGSVNTLTYWSSATGVSATSSPTVSYIYASSTPGVATSTFQGVLDVNAGLISSEYTQATTTTTVIDWSKGNNQIVKVGTGNVTFQFTNAMLGQSLEVMKCNAGTVTGTILWPAIYDPTTGNSTTTLGQSTGVGLCDNYAFKYTNATGTSIYFIKGMTSGI